MRLLIGYSSELGGAERILLGVTDAPGAQSCLACQPDSLAEAARGRGLRVFALHYHRLELRNQHDVVARRLGLPLTWLDDSAQAITFVSRRLLKRAIGPPAQRERMQLEAIRAVRSSRSRS